jgi:hypothetical protein
MEKSTGSPGFYLASSVTEKTLVANSEERLLSIMATLVGCQAALVANGNRDTAQLVSMAILELRIKLNHISDSELKALCDAMVQEEELSEQPRDPKPPQGKPPQGKSPQSLGGRPTVSLKLVK